MKSVAGRDQRTCRKDRHKQHVRRLSASGRPYVIRYSMTPRGLCREVVELRGNKPLASWSRNETTGALECHWRIHSPATLAANTSDQSPLPQQVSHVVKLRRDGVHADM
ncbi:hypothetical protein, partial [Dyella silvatica]|uniref:hypothetical protein n=1 Tax=Dyella silvatica TaxID=2992128 RepID=UPI002254309B